MISPFDGGCAVVADRHQHQHGELVLACHHLQLGPFGLAQEVALDAVFSLQWRLAIPTSCDP
jgi:hypothetical protein